MDDTPQSTDLNESVEEAIQFAKKYLEDMLSFFGLNTDVYATTEDNEVIELHVPSSSYNGFLIGQRGDTIRAIQFMISTALRSNGFATSRVNVDVADYKKAQADRLAEKAQTWFVRVKETGEPMHLRPMNAADRRIIHKIAGEEGLETESEGEGRDRHIVLMPTGGSAATVAQTEEEPAAEPEPTPAKESAEE